jgi:activator of 2-hydroxyglutaryl-CoA dehydratase
MAGRMGLKDVVAFTGGVARNAGVHRALEEMTGRTIRIPDEPQFTGALGAAILAARDVAALQRNTGERMHEVS